MREASGPFRLVCLSTVVGAMLLQAAISNARSTHPRRAADRGGCSNAATPAEQMSLGAVRAAVVCLINQQRAERGLPALTVSASLNRAAQDGTEEMVQNGSFGHGDPTGRMTADGYNWRTAGEDIATGDPTPESVVTAWMASAPHCQAILDPSYRDVGTGEVPEPVQGYSERPATWTEDFGLQAGSKPPSHDTGPANGCPY